MSIQAVDINALLNDKLYQVIGSTPASIAESLKKIDLKGKADVGAQMFAVSIFASAVNKATLETFVSDSRFAKVRPIITAALSISGRANMTALTLLGHCLMTTNLSSDVVFAAEFRKKMGQDHLWSGELDGGSLSDVQKKILKEKKRVTNVDEAKALGSGFLKHCGLMSGSLAGLEVNYFGTGSNAANVVNQSSTGTAQVNSGSIASGYNARNHGQTASSAVSPPGAPTDAGSSTRTGTTAVNDSPPSSSRRARAPTSIGTEDIRVSNESVVSIPADILAYRRNVLAQNENEIADSVNRRGVQGFIDATRTLMANDPTGERARNVGSTTGGR